MADAASHLFVLSHFAGAPSSASGKPDGAGYAIPMRGDDRRGGGYDDRRYDDRERGYSSRSSGYDDRRRY